MFSNLYPIESCSVPVLAWVHDERTSSYAQTFQDNKALRLFGRSREYCSCQETRQFPRQSTPSRVRLAASNTCYEQWAHLDRLVTCRLPKKIQNVFEFCRLRNIWSVPAWHLRDKTQTTFNIHALNFPHSKHQKRHRVRVIGHDANIQLFSRVLCFQIVSEIGEYSTYSINTLLSTKRTWCPRNQSWQQQPDPCHNSTHQWPKRSSCTFAAR